MTLPAEFALQHSEYNPFLFAPIWEEDNGSPLSVLSALTRLGLDPWGEAARLTGLSREAAASALARTLSRLPDNDCTPPEVTTIAIRLVQALPNRVPAASNARRDDAHPGSGRTVLVWICLTLAAVVISMAGSGWLS